MAFGPRMSLTKELRTLAKPRPAGAVGRMQVRSMRPMATLAKKEAQNVLRTNLAPHRTGQKPPTGALMRSVRVRGLTRKGQVELLAGTGESVPYAAFLELGWKSGARRVGIGHFRHFRGRVREATRLVDKSGQRLIRYPFLYPAAQQTLPKGLDRASRVWFRELAKHG